MYRGRLGTLVVLLWRYFNYDKPLCIEVNWYGKLGLSGESILLNFILYLLEIGLYNLGEVFSWVFKPHKIDRYFKF